jgi:integrase
MTRDLALFSVAIDTMLRASDLVGLRVHSVVDHNGEVMPRFKVVQVKTARPLICSLGSAARDAVKELIAERGTRLDTFLFTSSTSYVNAPMSTRQFRNLVKQWVEMIGLDPTLYSCHSLRRTKASIIYKRTRNVRAVQHLLGHASMQHTAAYLGVSQEDALEIAEEHEL